MGMTPVFILGAVATAGALLTSAGGLLLGYMCVRWSRSSGDRMAGVLIGALAVAHAAVPVLALTIARSSPVAAALLSAGSLVLSVGLGLVLPSAISATAQP